MQHKKPSRFHRIDRDMPKHHLEDDTAHLWAVSYADFLMVLLSFFILFFSVSQEDKSAIISIISEVKERGLGSGDGGGFSRTPTRVGPARDPSSIVSDIQNDLKDIKFETNKLAKSVTFMLEDDIYKLGATEPNTKGRVALKKLLDLLKPYQSDIDVVFVGHTDSLPIKKDSTLFVDDNFSLSALRAASAVKIALAMGMPRDRLFTHGSADNTRPTKSLSLVVKPRGSAGI